MESIFTALLAFVTGNNSKSMSVTLCPVWRGPVSTKSSAAATIGCLVAKRKSPSSTSYLFLSTSIMSSHSHHFDYSVRCACCGTHCRITECSASRVTASDKSAGSV